MVVVVLGWPFGGVEWVWRRMMVEEELLSGADKCCEGVGEMGDVILFLVRTEPNADAAFNYIIGIEHRVFPPLVGWLLLHSALRWRMEI